MLQLLQHQYKRQRRGSNDNFHSVYFTGRSCFSAMNSILTFAVLCISVILLGSSVQSRPSQRLALKRDEGDDPLCDFIVAVLDGTIAGADLNLTPEQEDLLPQRNHKRTSGNDGDDQCLEQQDQWIASMIPFFESLSEKQQDKLIEAFNDLFDNGENTQRAVGFAKKMFKRAMTNQRKRHYKDESDE
jgi:hypothetical protein